MVDVRIFTEIIWKDCVYDLCFCLITEAWFKSSWELSKKTVSWELLEETWKQPAAISANLICIFCVPTNLRLLNPLHQNEIPLTQLLCCICTDITWKCWINYLYRKFLKFGRFYIKQETKRYTQTRITDFFFNISHIYINQSHSISSIIGSISFRFLFNPNLYAWRRWEREAKFERWRI